MRHHRPFFSSGCGCVDALAIIVASPWKGKQAATLARPRHTSRGLVARIAERLPIMQASGEDQRKHHLQTRRLGQSSLNVTVLSQGGASLGDLYCKITDAAALGALEAAHGHGINLFDTSPWYGVGLSEARFGLALHRLPRDEFAVQTKVGRFLVPDANAVNGTAVGWIGGYHFGVKFDYTADAIQRQYEDSLQRLGLGRIESLVIHDLEPTPHLGACNGDGARALDIAEAHLAQLRGSGFAKLADMRKRGLIKAFGAGVNSDEDGEDAAAKRAWNKRYVDSLLSMHEGGGGGGGQPLDFLLLANMHSLLNADANESGILDACEAKGVSVIIGGPYSSGILATGADPADGKPPMYNYAEASEEVRERTRRIEECCKAHGVPLIAAALQYPLRRKCVACVIPGGKSAEEVASNAALMNVDIPEGLWADLERKGLVPTVPQGLANKRQRVRAEPKA